MADPLGPLAQQLLANSIFYGGDVTAPPGGGAPPAGMTAPPAGATNNYADSRPPAEEEGEPTEVYLGKAEYETEQDTPRGYGSQTSTKKTDRTAHSDALLRAFQTASAEEQRNMALLLSMGGYAGSGSLEDRIEKAGDMTLADTIDAYNALLTEAAEAWSVNRRKITPEQVLKQAIAYRLPTGTTWDGDFGTLGGALSDAGILKPEELEEEGAKAEKKKLFTGTKSSTTSRVTRSIMDPNDAQALTRGLLQRELGRDPTEEEFADFISAIQYAQQSNPSRSTTTGTRTYKKGELVDQSYKTTTHQGITGSGIQDVATQKARSNPGWAEWQAIGTYAPALFEALGSTVPGR